MLTDEYGLSWQVFGMAPGRMLTGDDQERARRVMTALLKMDEIDLQGLEQVCAAA